jgi:hypothetical protein
MTLPSSFRFIKALIMVSFTRLARSADGKKLFSKANRSILLINAWVDDRGPKIRNQFF